MLNSSVTNWNPSFDLQSPPKESIHLSRAEYSKLRGAWWKVGGAPLPPFSWSKFRHSKPTTLKSMRILRYMWILRYFPTEVALNFWFLCRCLSGFQSEAWFTLNQLNGGCATTPTFPLFLLAFEYLALPQVYTLFWCRLYFEFGCVPVACHLLCNNSLIHFPVLWWHILDCATTTPMIFACYVRQNLPNLSLKVVSAGLL